MSIQYEGKTTAVRFQRRVPVWSWTTTARHQNQARQPYIDQRNIPGSKTFKWSIESEVCPPRGLNHQVAWTSKRVGVVNNNSNGNEHLDKSATCIHQKNTRDMIHGKWMNNVGKRNTLRNFPLCRYLCARRIITNTINENNGWQPETHAFN